MKCFKTYLVISLYICLVIFGCANNNSLPETIYPIPYIERLVIDGQLDDWNEQGFQFELCANTDGETDTADFRAVVKIGWNEQGLLLACQVRDDSIQLSQRQIYNNDGLELFVSQTPGTSQMLQYILPAGALSGNDGYRADRYDFRISQPTPNTRDLTVATSLSKNTYTLEALVPLQELGIPCDYFSGFGLQLLFDDADGGGRRSKSRYSWNYYADTYLNNQALHRVKLVSNLMPQTTDLYQTVINLVDDEYYTFTFVAARHLARFPVEIHVGDQLCYTGELQHKGDYATATFQIDADEVKNPTEKFNIYIDGVLYYHATAGDVNVVFSKPVPVPARFEYDIRLYELRNAQHPPTDNAILFLGSSSIRLWSTLESDFPGYDVVKCGFGGSRTEDVLYYFDRIVKPWPWKKIVLFCGINDINARVPVDTIMSNVKRIIEKTRNELPDCQLLLLSNSVSVSRRQNYDKVVALNQLYRDLADQYDHVKYVDVFTPLLDDRGGIRPDLFSGDSTHMNPRGYRIWRNVLLDEL